MSKTKRNISEYYKAEKQNAFYLMIFGVLSLAVALICIILFLNYFWYSLGCTIFIMGICEIYFSAKIYTKSDEDMNEILGRYSYTPSETAIAEHTRMKKYSRNLKRLSKASYVLLFIGFILCFFKISSFGGDLNLGFGVGLIIEGAALLIYTLYTQWHANIYFRHLHHIIDRF